MPTASDACVAEALRWTNLAAEWEQARKPELWEDRPPTELAVVVFYDPTLDLAERAVRWGHELTDGSLPSLALFAAALATVEGEAWGSGAGDVAVRAYESRRFLLGDRIIHWAVPWLDAMGRCYPERREPAHRDRDLLLEMGDDTRVAPLMSRREGLVLEGEDSYGVMEVERDQHRWLSSLWSGHLMLEATWASLAGVPGSGGGAEKSESLSLLYEIAAHRWRATADRHPGSAQIWWDLSQRAESTSWRLAR